MLLTLSGSIGAGKTSWGSKIAEHFGVQLLEERVEGNPFLAKYYDSPEMYAFHLQVFFLNHRFRAIKEAMMHPNTVLDRSIYEDALVFAKLQYENGGMDEDSYKTYLELHENMMQEIHDLYDGKVLMKKSPDLLVHVHGSFEEILNRVKKRGRPYEQVEGNPELLQYYKDLYEMYSGSFLEDYKASPVYVLDIDKYDSTNPEHVQIVMKEIEDVLRKERGFAFPEEPTNKALIGNKFTLNNMEGEVK